MQPASRAPDKYNRKLSSEWLLPKALNNFPSTLQEQQLEK